MGLFKFVQPASVCAGLFILYVLEWLVFLAVLVFHDRVLFCFGYNFVVLKPFCHNLGSMLGVIVHLEDPFETKI